MSNISSDSGSPLASAARTAMSIERSKYLRLPSPVSGSVRLSARIASRLCWRLLISVFDSASRFFQRLVGLVHLAGRLHQAFDDRLDLIAVLGSPELLAGALSLAS